MLHQLFMPCNSGGSVKSGVSLTMPCFNSTYPNAHTHGHHLLPMECQSRSDFYQARLLCVRYEAQKCLLFHCLPKSPHSHPQCPFRAGKWSPFCSSREETCHSPQHYWSKGNGGRRGCQNESGCVHAPGKSFEVAPGLQSHGPTAAWDMDLQLCLFPSGIKKKKVQYGQKRNYCTHLENIGPSLRTIVYVNLRNMACKQILLLTVSA